jgi:hypothetical protein
MNRADREELKGLIQERIKERINQLEVNDKENRSQLRAEIEIQIMDGLGILDEYTQLTSLTNQYKMLGEQVSEASHALKENLRLKGLFVRYNGFEYIQEAIRNELDKEFLVKYVNTPTGQEIQNLRNELNNLRRTLLVAQAPEEFKRIFDAVDRLTGSAPTRLEEVINAA